MNTILNNELMHFIKNSPSCYHAIAQLKQMVEEAGFQRLKENTRWEIKKGGKYYVIRNESSIIAFRVSELLTDYHFQIASSHSDSPTFKVKEISEVNKQDYLQLNVEGYGGMICSTWMDRPLSLAGRVLLKQKDKLVSRLLNVDKNILLIPNIPIHMERTLNSGFQYNIQVDMLPLFSGGKLKAGALNDLIADELKVDKDAIYGKDLFLYNRQQPTVWGYQDEFLSAPKLDDLECAFAGFKALISSTYNSGIQVAACFDNEEVGSLTKQGADSTFMQDVLTRINTALGYDEEEYHCAIAKSFMASCDNAHALHPNHPEKYDAQNYTLMNHGVVVKHNANQKYTTDAFSNAILSAIADKAKVPLQHYANRSDIAGGSTLGNLSNAHVSMHCVDIGLAQLAMHSSFETAGSSDLDHLVKLLITMYNANLEIEDSLEIKIN